MSFSQKVATKENWRKVQTTTEKTREFIWDNLIVGLGRWLLIALIFLFLIGATLSLYEARNFQRLVASLTDETRTNREVLLVIDNLYRNGEA
ncbi:MAG: hypothetical protein AAGC83_13365, partial [Pseudomonadota bacterium]